MKEEKGIEKVEFNRVEDFEHLFTDIVQVKGDLETVYIDLGLKDKDGKSATVKKVVIMTMPHFLRFTEVCKKLSDTYQVEIKKQEK